MVLGDRSYPYHFGYDCTDRIAATLGESGADRFLVVTDDTLLALHGDKLILPLRRHAPVDVLSMPRGEQMKSVRGLSAHLERAFEVGATRRSAVVAFGGGAPGNLAGMIAALLFRGIALFHVPTTTVAAMDSVISMKQAINSSRGKNQIGTYYAPAAVYTDVALLETLPVRELRSGLCEAAKNCLAIRPEALDELRRILRADDLASPATLLWLLDESLTAKAAVTIADGKEQGSGLILEYGHTVGHALELLDQRIRGADGLSHGDAVALGMLVAARVAVALGALRDEDARVHEEMVELLGAPTRLPAWISVADVIDMVRTDNKRGYLPLRDDECAMVLLAGLGVPLGPRGRPLVAVPIALVEEVLTRFQHDGARAAPSDGPGAASRLVA